jgi:DNA adenine methylase
MSINEMTLQSLKPFLKWAGGKTQLIGEITKRIPYHDTQSFTYIEPFVGSGAVFFWIINNFPNIKSAVINDMNSDLIITYQTIAERVEHLIEILKNWEREYYTLINSPDKKSNYYYSKRELYNSRSSENIIQSALFIFLNRTCFNGLYRVNRRDLFNVPIGNYKKPTICNELNLRAVSLSLQKVKILNTDFENTLKYATDNSFFYFDPPYKPLNKTSSFNSYAKNIFDDYEQIRLLEFCDKLNSLGHKWLLSNSDSMEGDLEKDFFDKLYANYNINRVSAKRSINSNGQKRGLLKELLITNY